MRMPAVFAAVAAFVALVRSPPLAWPSLISTIDFANPLLLAPSALLAALMPRLCGLPPDGAGRLSIADSNVL